MVAIIDDITGCSIIRMTLTIVSPLDWSNRAHSILTHPANVLKDLDFKTQYILLHIHIRKPINFKRVSFVP